MGKPLLVRDLMTSDVLAVRPRDDLALVARTMWEAKIRHMPVIDLHGALVGLISQRDLLRNQLIEQDDQPPSVERAILESLAAEDVMQTQLEVVEPNTALHEAAQLMFSHKLGCLPVTFEGQLAGILTEADFVRRFIQDNERQETPECE